MRTGSFLVGLLLILVGVVLFAINLGYASWELARQLVRLWPVILIFIGISLIWGGKLPRWLGWAIVIVLVGGFIFFIFQGAPGLDYYGKGLDYYGNRQNHLIVNRTDYSGVTSGELGLSFEGGKLTLDSDTEQWFTGDFSGSGPISKVKEAEHRLNVDLRQSPPRWRGFREDLKQWELGLSPELQWDISLQAGAVKAGLNLENIALGKLEMKLGAGEVDMKLGGKAAHTTVKIDAGASKLKVMVPREVGVSISLDGALTDTNIDELGWTMVDKRYVSPGYEDNTKHIDIDLELAVGNFELETYAADLKQL